MRRLIATVLIACPMLACAFGPMVRNMMLEIASRRADDLGPVTDGLVAYWSMRESGGTVYDEADGNDGTVGGDPGAVLFGPQYGVRGDGVEWDGTTGHILLDGFLNHGQILLTQTVSFWVYIDADSEGKIMGTVNDGNNQFFDIESVTPFGETDLFLRARAREQADNGTVTWSTITTGALAEDAWTHVVVIPDESASKFLIYINAVEAATSTTSSTWTADLVDWDYPLVFGGWNLRATITGYVGAMADEIRIFNRGITQSEITALYDHDKDGAGH